MDNRQIWKGQTRKTRVPLIVFDTNTGTDLSFDSKVSAPYLLVQLLVQGLSRRSGDFALAKSLEMLKKGQLICLREAQRKKGEYENSIGLARNYCQSFRLKSHTKGFYPKTQKLEQN